MGDCYKLHKTCKKCGVRITDRNKTGFCDKHRDRTGVNNPFYEKKHSEKTKKHIKEVCQEKTKQLWQNEEYINNVKQGLKSEINTLAHKSIRFRQKAMKRSWKLGLIKMIPRKSKMEIEFGEMLQKSLKENSVYLDKEYEKQKSNNHFVFPDFKYKNFIVEFDGDYWHARNYKDDEYVCGDIKAKQIRREDTIKNKIYEKNGFKVIRIWETDFKKNKQQTIDNIVKILEKNA